MNLILLTLAQKGSKIVTPALKTITTAQTISSTPLSSRTEQKQTQAQPKPSVQVPPPPAQQERKDKPARTRRAKGVCQDTDLFEVPLSEAELITLQEFKERWNSRTNGQKLVSSDGWQRTQERFLPLLVLEDAEREEEFNARRDKYDWTMQTASQYWSAMIKAAETIRLLITVPMRAYAKVLRALSKEEDPSRKTVALQDHQMEEAASKLTDLGDRLALKLAFALGQRMGDTLQLRVDCMTIVDDRKTTSRFLAVLYRKGKTTRRRQPFAVHLPLPPELDANGRNDFETLGSELYQYQQAQSALRPHDDYLFPNPPKRLDAIRLALKAVDQSLCILSIRRGGLQLMAISGCSESVLLHHSRHASVEMLHRYLEWGTFALYSARSRFPTVQQTEPDADGNPTD